MAIVEELKCTCPDPIPAGPFIFGVQRCKTCDKAANWRDFE